MAKATRLFQFKAEPRLEARLQKRVRSLRDRGVIISKSKVMRFLVEQNLDKVDDGFFEWTLLEESLDDDSN